MIKTIINILASVMQGLVQYYVSAAVRQYQKITECSDEADKQRDVLIQDMANLVETHLKGLHFLQEVTDKGMAAMQQFELEMEKRLAKQKELDKQLGI